MSMRLWGAVALISVTTGVLLGTLYLGHRLGSTQEREKHQAEQKARQEGQDKALIAAAKAIAKIEVKSETIKQDVIREIRTVPVYRDCVHSPDGVRNINSLITGEEGTSPTSPGLP